MHKIGFVGLGNIGGPMARSVARGGFALTVFDRDAEALRAFDTVGYGAVPAPAALASMEAVVFMVSNDQQLRDAVAGPDGLIAGLGAASPGLVIIMSTVLPATVIELSVGLTHHGIRVVDAPVSGGPLPAEEGALTIMAGGAADDLEAARPVLETMGTTIYHCGPLGSGELTKIINNLVGVANQFLVAEALQLARSCNLDLAHLTSVMERSSGRNFWSRDWDLTRRQYDEYATDLPKVDVFVQRSLKDFRLALELAERAAMAMPVLKAVTGAIAMIESEQIFERFHSFTGA
jgi:3-hydroxyisobutyrate dehydrogenase